MNATLEYKKAGVEDALLLAELRIEFFEDFFGKQNNEARLLLQNHLEAYFKEHLNNGIYVSYFATVNGDIAGVGGMIVRRQPGNFKNPSGRSGYVLNMYTRPMWRRQGICKKILDLLVAEAKNLDLGLLELHSTKEGEYVYPANGFVLHPEPTYRMYLK